MDLLVQLTRSRGMSTMFITHDLGLAAQYCDRVIIMQNGQVVGAGDDRADLLNPRQAYTRRLRVRHRRVIAG